MQRSAEWSHSATYLTGCDAEGGRWVAAHVVADWVNAHRVRSAQLERWQVDRGRGGADVAYKCPLKVRYHPHVVPKQTGWVKRGKVNGQSQKQKRNTIPERKGKESSKWKPRKERSMEDKCLSEGDVCRRQSFYRSAESIGSQLNRYWVPVIGVSWIGLGDTGLAVEKTSRFAVSDAP